MTFLEPGRTCWRSARTPRVACLVDNEAYYKALVSAFDSANRSIYILGWAFDPRTRLAPDGTETPNDPDEIGRILIDLSRSRPNLEICILVWKSPMGINGHEGFGGNRAKRWFKKTNVQFREARDVPFGACHHQKIVVIDDRLAFCGGGDIVPNRWDTSRHPDNEPRRILPNRARHVAVHEVMVMVDGATAASLGELFRERWANAVGERLGEARPTLDEPWPVSARPLFSDVEVGIALTRPEWRGRAALTEVRELTFACIAQACRTIYLENQYFTCQAVADALASRLGQPHGPEIILIVNKRAPSWFDQLTMDHARNPLIRSLRAADRFGRFRAFSPSTSAGHRIVVHSKVSVFDDRLLRIGSANLNNRSAGFDTECDLAIEAESEASRRRVSDFRDLLLSHYLAVDSAQFTRAKTSLGGVIGAIDALNDKGRLAPVLPGKPTAWEGFVSSRNLGDPSNADESWRLRRRRSDGGRGRNR